MKLSELFYSFFAFLTWTLRMLSRIAYVLLFIGELSVAPAVCPTSKWRLLISVILLVFTYFNCYVFAVVCLNHGNGFWLKFMLFVWSCLSYCVQPLYLDAANTNRAAYEFSIRAKFWYVFNSSWNTFRLLIVLCVSVCF